MKLRLFLPVIFLLCRILFADVQAVFDQMQASLQDQNKQQYFQLLGNDPDLQKQEQDFFAEFLKFHAERTLLKLIEKKKTACASRC